VKAFLALALKRENRLGLAGAFLLVFILGISLAAPLAAPYNPFQRSGQPFEKPGPAHLLGCNDVGHDLLSELIYGGRVSLSIGLFAAFCAALTASAAALAAGYFGGALDRLLMRIVDVVMALPFLPLVIVLGVFLGSGMGTQILVIALVMWASPCRELRSQVLKLRSRGYIDASRAMGEKPRRIILRHILPEIFPLIVPQFVLTAQSAILIESSLSFLGLGDPVSKSWGSMLFFANTRAAFLTGAWVYWVLPPGLCIALSCLSFALIGFSLGGKRGLEFFAYGSFKRPGPEAGFPALSGEAPPLPLSLAGIEVRYGAGDAERPAVSGVNLELRNREVLGIVGESGCGKTTLAMTVLGLLRFPASLCGGRVFINGEDMLSGEMKILRLRGKTIAYIPQNAMNTLNPVISVRNQLIEAVRVHRRLSKGDEEREVERLLGFVGIGAERKDAFNHELSGGMKQRVVIAMALANNPDILIADEPTTGLDVLVQKSILELLMDLKEAFNISIILITHDLPLALRYGDTLAVMYRGALVDYGAPGELCRAPRHDHTRALLSGFPRLGEEKAWDREEPGGEGSGEALIIRGLSKTFYPPRRLLGKAPAPIRAVRDASFTLRPGEVLGLIGGSGSGKTTVSRLILGLEKPDAGEILLDGRSLRGRGDAELRRLWGKVHLVFQDPYESIRNSMSLFDVVAEPLLIRGGSSRAEIRERVRAALEDVRLPSGDSFVSRSPSQLSGGQRQRLSFARALAANPRYIIADEPTSMLDVSLRKDLLALMEDLRRRRRIGYLFITHDLSLAYHFCDHLMVMMDGAIVEKAPARDLVRFPAHRYTRELISAVETPEYAAAGQGLSV
jgi:ABC-type glutathione transport system ATPase component/ABC-type dipeptide/oligopeptide/nickel transport system permease subunit